MRFSSQFYDCPLIWRISENNEINRLHERCLRIIYNETVSIHERNIKVLATEIFKVRKNLAPPEMHEIFKLKVQPHCNLR